MNPVRIHEGWAIPGGGGGAGIHDRTTFVILCNASIKRNGQPVTTDMTLYLTLTPIFSDRKAKINLHITPKLTVDMPISCLLRSIQFRSPQNDAITCCTCACFLATSLYVFSRAP